MSAESLHPGDRLDTLFRMSVTFDGFDPLDVVFRLERLLGVSLARERLFPDESTSGFRVETLGDLGRLLVERLRVIVSTGTGGT